MKCLVTGVAGFIGSQIAARLLKDGHEVKGVDIFDPYYDKSIKLGNIAELLEYDSFHFFEQDITYDDMDSLIQGCDYVFHMAAQAGVRNSWGEAFVNYSNNNVLGTQRLLEASARHRIKRFIFASSSSVYGNNKAYPLHEDYLHMPISPYAVTKVAGEQLCKAYNVGFGLNCVMLRFFSVYGPKQRPDGVFNIFIKAILENRPLKVFGDGEQSRAFTYIDDIVNANVLAMGAPEGCHRVNVAGLKSVTLNYAIGLLKGHFPEKNIQVDYQPPKNGDVLRSEAALDKAFEILGYEPQTGIEQGLENEIRWMVNSFERKPVPKTY